MSVFSRLSDYFFGTEIARRVSLAVRAIDDFRDRPAGVGDSPRDRYTYDRLTVLKDALAAWRLNPLARRIVSLTSQYVVGGGLAVGSEHDATHKFLQDWWTHRLNHMAIRAFEWCDELTRSGELFVVLSTDVAGMSYVRAIPAIDIKAIETLANDVEQEKVFVGVPPNFGDDDRRWNAYDENSDGLGDGAFTTVMFHYAINRPVGAKHGESDLAPLLRWLARHAAWLEDRARLNRFRQSFAYVVYGKFKNATDRLARQAEINANPPDPGSVLVADKDSEEWQVIHPKLDSFEASEDGLAMKKMIAAGSGNPLHFLAEPESATRTTAEQAGGPTFRHYEQRQLFFLWLLSDLAKVVVARRAQVDQHVSKRAEVKARGTDIFARDNAALAVSASTVINAFMQLRARGLIDDAELMRLAYKFAGEVVDVRKLLADGMKAEQWPDMQGKNQPAAVAGASAAVASALAEVRTNGR